MAADLLQALAWRASQEQAYAQGAGQLGHVGLAPGTAQMFPATLPAATPGLMQPGLSPWPLGNPASPLDVADVLLQRMRQCHAAASEASGYAAPPPLPPMGWSATPMPQQPAFAAAAGVATSSDAAASAAEAAAARAEAARLQERARELEVEREALRRQRAKLQEERNALNAAAASPKEQQRIEKHQRLQQRQQEEQASAASALVAELQAEREALRKQLLEQQRALDARNREDKAGSDEGAEDLVRELKAEREELKKQRIQLMEQKRKLQEQEKAAAAASKSSRSQPGGSLSSTAPPPGSPPRSLKGAGQDTDTVSGSLDMLKDVPWMLQHLLAPAAQQAAQGETPSILIDESVWPSIRSRLPASPSAVSSVLFFGLLFGVRRNGGLEVCRAEVMADGLDKSSPDAEWPDGVDMASAMNTMRKTLDVKTRCFLTGVFKPWVQRQGFEGADEEPVAMLLCNHGEAFSVPSTLADAAYRTSLEHVVSTSGSAVSAARWADTIVIIDAAKSTVGEPALEVLRAVGGDFSRLLYDIKRLTR
eukprot:TRINITY_DN65829_c0_g1_i1.p1 TRINITY_DN65829_c0_g1~~TRINITY_DN65829_c0_g1_i1.p1  ORF type:complete len:537 (-),score=169.34 TRINITY_DN65829_c0_g1_i1:64-1674(-)